MWQHISFTLSTALQTYNRAHKNWAKLGVTFAIIYLILGFVISFCTLVGMGLLMRPEWADMNNGDQYIYIWLNHAAKLDIRILISSAGLLAAYFSKHTEEDQPAFDKYSRFLPGKAFQLFLLMAVVQGIFYYAHLTGSMHQLANTDGIMNNFFRENRNGYLLWLNGAMETAGDTFPYLVAAFLYAKASGLKTISLYKNEVLGLLVVAYAFSTLVSTAYVLINKIALTPLIIPLDQGMTLLLSEALYFFMHAITMMPLGYIVYSAFREEEITLD